MPAFRLRPNEIYFFSGVLAAGGAVGVAFTLAFLSSFVGLTDGVAVDDGLEVTTGVVTTTGVEAGVAATGLLVGVSPQAAEIAAMAAKTVSRIDLLIVFSLFIDRKAFFQGSRDR
jgi:hypothetical protein